MFKFLIEECKMDIGCVNKVCIELKIISIEDLKNMLNEAISKEDYETATDIRDKINKLKVSKVS